MRMSDMLIKHEEVDLLCYCSTYDNVIYYLFVCLVT